MLAVVIDLALPACNSLYLFFRVQERTDALVDEYRKQKKFDKTAGYESQEEFELERKVGA